jgi:hypothetical protein
MPKQHAIWKCGRATVTDRRTGTRRIGCNYYNVYISRTNSKRSVRDPYRGVKSTSKTSPYGRAQRGSGIGEYRPRKVDTQCRHCGARARFQLSPKRGDGRGRKRRVSVSLKAIHPRDWVPNQPSQEWKFTKLDEFTVEELIETANRMNNRDYDDRVQIGFVPAKIYRDV